MKRTFALLVALAMVFSLTACGGGASSASQASTGGGDAPAGGDATTPTEPGGELDTSNPVVIGLLDAFTGDRAMSGMYAKEGAEMFLEHINANGGVLGRQLVIQYEDDQGNETVGTNAYQKITSQYDLSATILSKFSSVVLAIDPFVEEMEIPALCAGSSVRIAESTNPWLYSMRKSDYESGLTIAGAADELLGMTKVAILHAPDALGTGLAPVIQADLERRGIEIVSVQQFTADEKNFAPYLAKIIDSGCDGIVSVAQQVEAALIMVAIDEANLDIPCIGGSAFCQQTALQNAGASANGWHSTTAWSPTVHTEPAKSWIAEYTEKYGHEPDMSSALTYDALAVLCAAMESCGSSDPADINKALQEMKDFEGLASTYSYQDGTRMMATSEFITHIQDEKSIIIDTIAS